jgi:hypothetical protein
LLRAEQVVAKLWHLRTQIPQSPQNKTFSDGGITALLALFYRRPAGDRRKPLTGEVCRAAGAASRVLTFFPAARRRLV